MVATTASTGMGVKIQRKVGSVYSELGEIIEVTGPDLARDVAEATHSLSDQRYKEFISALRDAGELSCILALVPSATNNQPHRELFDDFENDSPVTYRVLFPGGAVNFEASGFITGLTHALPIDDRMTVSVTIKLTGVVELNAAA